jgi:caa(3)-type oxidase subunit IV
MTHAVGDQVSEAHAQTSHAQFYWVWGGLLFLTLVEVMLAYNQIFTPGKMLAVLIALSIVKSAMIIGYFMHLKFEYPPMRFVLMAALVLCLVLMAIFFPDAERVLPAKAGGIGAPSAHPEVK